MWKDLHFSLILATPQSIIHSTARKAVGSQIKALHFPAIDLQRLSNVLRIRFKTFALIHNALCNMASAPRLCRPLATLVVSALSIKNLSFAPQGLCTCCSRYLEHSSCSCTRQLLILQDLWVNITFLQRFACLPTSVKTLVIISIPQAHLELL